MDQETPAKFSGTLDRIRLIELVQMACLAGTSRDIAVEVPDDGAVYIRSGQVVHALLGRFSGEEAFQEILLRESGCFRFDAGTQEVPAVIKKSWEQLLIESIGYRSEKGLSTAPVPNSGLSGSIVAIDLADLVPLCTRHGDRVLWIRTEKHCGTVCFADGRITHAQCGNLAGESAFIELMQEDGGEFESQLPEGNEPITIEQPWESLVIEAVRCRDEKQAAAQETDARSLTLLQKLQRLKVSEKIRLAMTADKEARTHLMRDSNRMVQLAVIGNPRLSEGEVTLIAGSKSIDEEVLRRIAANREWMRLHQVRLALVTNPKCPLAIASRLIQTLGPLEWRTIAASRSVPAAVSQMAKRLSGKSG